MILVNNLILFFELHNHLSYLILFLGSYFETLIGPGFFIYGEIFFLSGGILSGVGVLNIVLVFIVCIGGGILGDSSSYLIGAKYGDYIINRLFKEGNRYLNPKNYDKSKKFMDKNGAKGIFLARLAGPLSWIVPFIAGTMKIKYKKFLRYNVPGVVVGISIFLFEGYLLGYSYNLGIKVVKEVSIIAGLIFILSLGIIMYNFKINEKLLQYSKKVLNKYFYKPKVERL